MGWFDVYLYVSLFRSLNQLLYDFLAFAIALISIELLFEIIALHIFKYCLCCLPISKWRRMKIAD